MRRAIRSLHSVHRVVGSLLFAFCVHVWLMAVIGKTTFHRIKSKFKYCSSIIASRVYIYNSTVIRISTWELDYKVYTEVMKWNDRNMHIHRYSAYMRCGDKTLNKVNSVYSWKIKLIFMNFIFFFCVIFSFCFLIL